MATVKYLDTKLYDFLTLFSEQLCKNEQSRAHTSFLLHGDVRASSSKNSARYKDRLIYRSYL